MKKFSERKNEDRILLLSDIPPCKNYSGGIMLAQMTKFLLDEKKKVYCYCTMSDYLNPIYNTDINNDIELKIVKRPEENMVSATKSQYKEYYKEIKRIEKSIIDYIKDNKITKLWCPVQGEVLTKLLHGIYKKIKIDYVVQVWDPIEWWIKEHHFDEQREKETLLMYKELIQNAKKCITTSKSMSKKYSKEFKTKCIEVMPPLERVRIESKESPEDKIIIAMSGQIYAKEELDKLLCALDKMEWQYNKKDIFFYHYGDWNDTYIDFKRHEKYKERFIRKGFVEQDKLLQELSKCDLLYCPYFFSKDKTLKKVAELSFPSKLVTYLAIDVPVLLHAPDYASPYKFLKENDCAYFIDTINTSQIKDKLITILKFSDREKILQNEVKAFNSNFTFEKFKQNFLEALDLKYDGKKKLNILEVNNIDLSGRRFNGYDLQEEINKNTIHRAKQIVTYKESKNDKVLMFYNTNEKCWAEWRLMDAEANELAVHSQLSFTSNILKNNDSFINADIVHYHLIHNTKLSLYQMIELCSNKPSIWTFHDPWPFTGRCVYPQECEEWKTGCKKCKYLDNLFPLKKDNCKYLWELKRKIYEKLDIDIVITTPFMDEMIKNSPLTQCFKNVHIIPFGIDLNKFNNTISKEEARRKLNIPQGDIVLFFRAQMAMKGTEYIIEALKKLDTNVSITLVSCSEIGLLEELKNKYNVIELGNIEDEEMILAYNACDIFLMPSRSESFGLMAIEAMACSRPIIIFNNSALPSVTFAPECGVLVENKNSDKLMEAIKYMIDNPEERERRGKLGRKLAEQHYDINVYHKKILELYEQVYERQKDKKPQKISTQIDYSREDVQLLIKKLKKIYPKVFSGESLEADFLKNEKDIKFKKGLQIDYSDDSIQNLIVLFNKYIYERLNRYEEEKSEKNSYSKITRIMDLYKNDRHELLHQISIKFSFNKIVYIFARTCYRFMRKIKHFICGDRYKRLSARVKTLEQQMYDVQYRLWIEEEKARKIEESNVEEQRSKGINNNTSI